MEARSGAGGLMAAEEVREGGAETPPFALHAVEQAAGPGEIDRQQGEAKQNHERAGAGADEQQKPEPKKDEARSNTEHATGLLERFEDKKRHSAITL